MADKFAIGFRGGYSYNKVLYPYNYQSKSDGNGVNIGLFARYYLFPATSRINFLIDGSYTFGHTKLTTTYTSMSGPPYYVDIQHTNSSEVKTSNYMLGIGPAIFLNNNVAIEVLMAYRYADYLDSEVRGHDFFVGAGFQIHLGKAPVVSK